jgi:hypothetical protein
MTIGKQIAVVLLIILQVGASIFMPISHQHALYGSCSTTQNIQSHNCGAREVHRDLLLERTCVICIQASQFAAYFPLATACRQNAVVGLSSIRISPPLLDQEHFSLPQRGPPLITA